MFSVIAADALAIADSPTLKSSPSLLPSRLHPADEYGASAWATDNSVLYLASAQSISRYNPSSNQLQTLHTLDDGYTIRCIAASDPTTVVFGAGAQVHILECDTSPPKIVQTLGPFYHDILTLSLSNDSTLLACGLSNAVHIHNFSTGSQTTLRGLPSSRTSTICVFHSHIRTRLLVGFHDQLFVYETTRPSAPLKVIPMNEAGGCISALACSPFSKTLVAVAMSSGLVGLVDLDKEKGCVLLFEFDCGFF
jgi:protein NEDD1